MKVTLEVDVSLENPVTSVAAVKEILSALAVRLPDLEVDEIEPASIEPLESSAFGRVIYFGEAQKPGDMPGVAMDVSNTLRRIVMEHEDVAQVCIYQRPPA